MNRILFSIFVFAYVHVYCYVSSKVQNYAHTYTQIYTHTQIRTHTHKIILQSNTIKFVCKKIYKRESLKYTYNNNNNNGIWTFFSFLLFIHINK